MTTRERCINILHYKDVDRLPAVHFGYWKELLSEWADQGHIMPGSKFELVQYYADEIKKITV